MRQTNAKPYQLGSALLTALFIMTLVAIVATAMSTRLQLDIYRARLSITSDKLYLASQFVTFWAMDTLRKTNFSYQFNDQKGSIKEYPTNLQYKYPDIKTTGALYDLQSLFNLNNLQDKKFYTQFIQLLEEAKTQATLSQRKSIIKAISYWISPYPPEGGQDNQLSFYLNQRPIYLPSYQLMQSPSELRLVRGVTIKLYQSLLPFITTLPETTPINLNTAPKALLRTLGNGLTDSDLEKLLTARGKKGFKNLNNIRPLLTELNISSNQITLESTYFMSIAETRSDELNLMTYTVFKRKKGGEGLLLVGIIRESLNTI
jgi:general secretion pathway protein K